ncbi:MAG: gluconate 2-dehydrogenase gamma chain [Mycobacterium sp.]|nr:gluconate 2-dehydrogenase gamma chain [Mycobacterium sp.]
MASDEAVPLLGVPPGASAEPAYRFLSRHQAAVLDAATRRLDPDPQDDPHELHVTVFVDCLLSVFRVAPGGLYAVGSLRQRVAELRSQYCSGIALLDELAGGDFTAVPPLRQQLILAQGQLAAFAGLLFGHIIEAMGHTEPEGADLRSR